VASRQIVCFPNFANLRNRLELLLMGRMPRAMLFGYLWWDTGHIHQLSVRDFEEYLPRVGLRIRRRAFFGRLATAASFAPNLFATLATFELEPAVVSSK
jgi:methionine biosynthesis protein MetW